LEITDAELADQYEQSAGYVRMAATLACGRRAWGYLDARPLR
jgi:hypothetical protein